MPTRPRASRARRHAASWPASSCARIASIIWVSMRRTGFSVIIGSWKIMAMRDPRSRASAGSPAATRSWPSKTMRPAVMRPGSSIRPMMEKPVTDLPDPDSPTRPRISPRRRARSMPSTARTTPARVSNSVHSPSMRSRSVLTARRTQRSPLQPRVEDVAQLVADQVDGHHRDQQRDAGEDANPTGSRRAGSRSRWRSAARATAASPAARGRESSASPRARSRAPPPASRSR